VPAVLYIQSITTTAAFLTSALIGSPDSGLINMYGIAKMLDYHVYLDIRFPDNLERVFKAFDQKNTKWPIRFFPAKRLRSNFRTLSSSFFVNIQMGFWCSVSSLLGVGLLTALKKATEANSKINEYTIKILDEVKWSFVVTYLCGLFIQASFFTTLELWTLSFDCAGDVISVILATLFHIVIIGAISLFLYILIDIWTLKAYSKCSDPIWKDKWKEYAPLYENVQHKTKGQLMYLMPICIRTYSFGFVYGGLTVSPTYQCCILLVGNVLMLVYVLYARPVENKFRLISIAIDELILILLDILSLCIIGMRASSEDYTVGLAGVGLSVISLYIAYYTKFICITLIYLILKFMKIYKERKKQNKADLLIDTTTLGIQMTIEKPIRTRRKSTGIEERGTNPSTISSPVIRLNSKTSSQNISMSPLIRRANENDLTELDITYSKDDSSMSIVPERSLLNLTTLDKTKSSEARRKSLRRRTSSQDQKIVAVKVKADPRPSTIINMLNRDDETRAERIRRRKNTSQK